MLRLAVRVRREDAEVVLAELLELAPSGVEEVELQDGSVEYAVYGAPGELPSLPSLRAAAGAALVEVQTREVADDWSERWREFHRPLVLEGRLTVRPPWEPPGDTPLDIVVDPGQAFGTGAHTTTRLCLELLLELAGQGRAQGPFLDLGCGSGVLAVSAAKLGFGPVVALDKDPAAVQATVQNAAANGVSLEVSRFDLRQALPPPAPVVTANLLSPLLIAWATSLESAPDRGPEIVVASGILAHEADRVASAFARAGLPEEQRRLQGDWAAMVLRRSLP
jgi:ribosomal protein L11 methyltransferase